jgi:anti-sigma regulatory factor (Ser/Thr protein kinase)
MWLPKDPAREADRPVLRLQLERNVEAASLARAAVLGFCEGRELSPGTIATLMLLTSEIVTNAVIHPDVDPPGLIGLYVRLNRDTVRIEVSDTGSGFTPQPRDPSRLQGGYGLYLVEKESKRWGVDQTPHTSVWFEVAREPAQATCGSFADSH